MLEKDRRRRAERPLFDLPLFDLLLFECVRSRIVGMPPPLLPALDELTDRLKLPLGLGSG
jgi:hypothetical protein